MDVFEAFVNKELVDLRRSWAFPLSGVVSQLEYIPPSHYMSCVQDKGRR